MKKDAEIARMRDALNCCAKVANAINPKNPWNIKQAHRELWCALEGVSATWPIPVPDEPAEETSAEPSVGLVDAVAQAYEVAVRKSGCLDYRDGARAAILAVADWCEEHFDSHGIQYHAQLSPLRGRRQPGRDMR